MDHTCKNKSQQLVQRKFQNKWKNIDKVYQLGFCCCIISLPYEITLSFVYLDANLLYNKEPQTAFLL
jgi:hypothetical protein